MLNSNLPENAHIIKELQHLNFKNNKNTNF